jgi:hypothetical protein
MLTRLTSCIAQVLALEAVTAITTLTSKLTQAHHLAVGAVPIQQQPGEQCPASTHGHICSQF